MAWLQQLLEASALLGGKMPALGSVSGHLGVVLDFLPVLIAEYQYGRQGRRVGTGILARLRLRTRPRIRVLILLTPLPLLLDALPIHLVGELKITFLILVVRGIRIPPPWPTPFPAAIETEAVTETGAKAKIVAVVIKAVETAPLEPTVVEKMILAKPTSCKGWVTDARAAESRSAESGIAEARPFAHPT